jgi:RNA polymerase sigma-70 factor (ECF subfamily)
MENFDPVPALPRLSEITLRSLLAVDLDAHFGSFIKLYHHEVRIIIRQVLNAAHLEEVEEADTLATAIFLQMYSNLKNLKPEEILKQHLWTKLYHFTVDRCFGQIVGKYETRMYNAVQQLLDQNKLEQSAAVITLAEEIFTSIRQQLRFCDQQAIHTSQFWLWLYNCIIAHCFEQLFETYRSQLEVFVLRLSSNSDDAEDIVQQALLSAFKHLKAHGIPSKDSTFNSRGWIFTIAKRAFLKSLRRNNPSGRDLSIENVSEEHPIFAIVDDCNVPPDVVLELAETQRYLAELVSGIPEPYREIVHLRFLDDRSNEEIAVLLSMKPVTVRSYIHRGIKLLRREMVLLK